MLLWKTCLNVRNGGTVNWFRVGFYMQMLRDESDEVSNMKLGILLGFEP